jgi:hypothetical protein
MKRKRLLLSAVAGFALTILLLALEAHRHNQIVALLEYPGVLAAIAIFGVNGGSSWFLPVMLFANTAVYGVFIFTAWMLVHVMRKLL